MADSSLYSDPVLLFKDKVSRDDLLRCVVHRIVIGERAGANAGERGHDGDIE